MAHLRGAGINILRQAVASGSRRTFQAPQRLFSSRFTGSSHRSLRPLVLAGVSLGAAYGVYTSQRYQDGTSRFLSTPFQVSAASALPESQASVFTPTKKHALYLTIHLTPSANARQCARVVANLQGHVDVVCPPDMRDEDDEILAGVGFGQDFYRKLSKQAKQDYKYIHRAGPLGKLPSTGGDIFIHAKSDEMSKLFELAQRITASLPAGSVDKYEDIYSFVYRAGRDLSGFIDGTENAADEESRQAIAVEKQTGGSYVITQRWIHRMDVISKEKGTTLESWVGRAIEDSTELKKKAITSHVARMTGGSAFEQKKVHEIVRQSMPYGNLHDRAGLFFIAYAASPENFNFMLDRMVGKGQDGHSDHIMNLSECITGNFWYFPSVRELESLK